jgi:hypothetical protein
VVCFGFWLIPLYTTVVRFSFNQRSEVRDQRTAGRRQLRFVRELENWRIRKIAELLTAYCAKRPEHVEWVEGLTAYRLLFTI